MAEPGLHIRYGSYAHQPGEVEYSRERFVEFNERDQPWLVRERWDLNGWLLGNDPNDMNLKLRALQIAYAKPNQSIGMHFPNGARTDVFLSPASTLSGIKVIRQPTLPDNRNAAFVTFLPYAISLEAEFPYNGNANMVLEFSETLDFEGGGPLFGHIETINSLPQKQRKRAATVFRAVQSGRAVGLFSRPLVPSPLWPADLVGRPRVRKPSAIRRGNGVTHWPIEWSYTFESVFAMFGEPNFWGFV